MSESRDRYAPGDKSAPETRRGGRDLLLWRPIRPFALAALGTAHWIKRKLDWRSSRYHWAARYLNRASGGPDIVPILLNLSTYALALYVFREAISATVSALYQSIGSFSVTDIAGAILALALWIYGRWNKRHAIAKAVDDLSRIDIVADPGFSISEVTLGEPYSAAGYELFAYQHGRGAWSKALSDWFVTRPAGTALAVAIDEGHFAGDPQILGVLGPKIAMDMLQKGKSFTNDRKVRLKNDALFHKQPAGRIIFERTDYLTTLCTSDMVGRLAVGESGAPLGNYAAAPKMVSADNRLKPYGELDLSNQLGASSLIFTSDGYLMLVEQRGSNIQSANLIAPSGSGSYDWADIEQDDEADFVDWACRTASREFLEESGLEPLLCGRRVKVDILPLGCGLYLHRGAKPELFFLGRIDLTKRDYYRIRRFSNSEALLSKHWPFTEAMRLADGQWSAAAVHAVLTRLGADKQRLSVPLEMAADMARYVCTAHGESVDAL